MTERNANHIILSYWHMPVSFRGRGLDSRHFQEFKCGLGLERGPPNRLLADTIIPGGESWVYGYDPEGRVCIFFDGMVIAVQCTAIFSRSIVLPRI